MTPSEGDHKDEDDTWGRDDGDQGPDFSRAGAHRKGISRRAEPVRAMVIHPYLAQEANSATGRDPDSRLEEAVGLAAAIELEVVQSLSVSVSQWKPATLMGSGKVEELAALIEAEKIGLVVVDTSLSPGQQRNLEKAWHTKVIDRTGLILEIFGARARTREGTLQVELAHLIYQKSRLVRSWTHLERQRGGLGFVGGPGETQIEADRRLLQERITKIRRQLETVTRTRQLHRSSRKKVPYPIVALVGYTNAGKSTLFNRVGQADVLAKDMLFATLDPAMRAVKLPSGRNVILSDTVGFISDLPTQLVAAFRATLEEVLEADILLHVRDIASEETDAQAEDVAHVLAELGLEEGDERPRIEVLNKADLLDADIRAGLAERVGQSRDPDARHHQVLLSAQTGEGVDGLLALIDDILNRGRSVLDLSVDAGDGALQSWLHQNADVMESRDDGEGRLYLRVGIDQPALGRLRKRLEAQTPGSDAARIITHAAD